MNLVFPILFLTAFSVVNIKAEYTGTSLKKLLQKSDQLIVVVSDNWDSPTAVMTCLEKSDGKYIQIGECVNVFLGKSGLGWGRGIIEFVTTDGPIKREGDKKAPAGVFSLPYVFGLLPPDSSSWLKYTYKQISKINECVDDTSSNYYNEIVNTLEIDKNWKSSENMDDQDYKYGIVISHNSSPVKKGYGSCIFFHLTSPKPKPTAGCTAMDEKSLLGLLHWLDEKKNPLLIQLPKTEFDKLSNEFSW
ncbi:MAG: L,D-transpeptidase family protein [Bacteroidota bacterium]